MKCSFCGEVIMEGTGKIFVEKSGKEKYFCSTKCEKNLFKLGRSPLHTKWTKRYQKSDS
jgi:large subunit ribosomal protein L24e